MARVVKNVTFNEEEEQSMLDFIDDMGVKFATYIKRLIKADMEKKEQQSEVMELVRVVSKLLDNGVTLTGSQDPGDKEDKEQDEPSLSESQKAAAMNVLNMFKGGK